MDVERRQGARVLEHDTHAAREIEDRASEARRRIRALADDPVTIHTEMDVDHAAILEMNELVFPATFDHADARASQRSKRGSGDAPAQRGMQDLHSLDDRLLNCVAQCADGSLDLRKLWHASARNRSCC